jgi:hypothetical protein
MAKISKPVLYTVLLGVAALIFVYATEPDPAPAGTGTKRTATKTVNKKADVYLPEDYKAKFASLNEVPKDAFHPLVVRKTSGTQASPPDPDGIPFDATGGEPDWHYTGLVEVNGTKMALIENDSTGEGVYLRRGDRWKKIVVSSISDEALILVGPGGTPFRIKLGERGEEPAAPTGTNPTPLQPPLQGVIGAGSANVPPLPGITTNDLAVQPENGNDGRRPRRRRRQQ